MRESEGGGGGGEGIGRGGEEERDSVYQTSRYIWDNIRVYVAAVSSLYTLCSSYSLPLEFEVVLRY